MKHIDGLTFLEYIQQRLLVLDGAFGTFFLKNGLEPGTCPELFAYENPDLVREVQQGFIKAGSRAIYTCTLGGNAVKLDEFGLSGDVERINTTLARLSVEIAGDNAFVGGDVSPTGVFLRPLGDLDFERAVDVFKQQVCALAKGGVDFIVIETMIDIQEARAAVIAAKESCDLPVVACMTFDENGRTLTGTSPAAAAIALISAGADVVGLNCSTGPAQMVSSVKEMKAVSSVPLIVKPNAGMPKIVNGQTHFDLSCDEFSTYIKPLCEAGANLIGGCCGTDADYVRAIADHVRGLKPILWKDALPAVVTSVMDTVYFGESFRVIGERINPTGKPKLKEAIQSGDFDTVLNLAVQQKNGGAHLLDVNMGVPGGDEITAMQNAIEHISVHVKLPICIDSSDSDVAAQALRIYPGRALLNSLSAKTAHIEKLLPLIKKYRPMVVLLPIGDNGIPKTADARIEVINKAFAALEASGLTKNDLLIDALVMAVSSDADAAKETLKVVSWCRDNGFHTVCGLSNGSFGLPERSHINAAYLMMAIQSGLSAAIMDPNDEQLMNQLHAAEALCGRDKGFERYIARFAGSLASAEQTGSLYEAVLSGKKNAVTALIDAQMAQGIQPQAIINDIIIPALNEVGERYEKRVYFLPQLIYSAEAASRAFDHLEKFVISDESAGRKATVVIATVRGDIHDIGKNLVSMLLRNHGFSVVDLGKDVPAQIIIDAAQDHGADIIGLSALITTTAPEMEKIIALKNERGLQSKVMVGGAVVTEEYARSIGADGYAQDAAEAVKLASRLLEK